VQIYLRSLKWAGIDADLKITEAEAFVSSAILAILANRASLQRMAAGGSPSTEPKLAYPSTGRSSKYPGAISST
jgi:hypothetical protein